MANKTKNKTNQQLRVLAYLRKGYSLSPVQIANRLNTSPNRARFIISDLRKADFNIVTNRTVKSSGQVVTKYELYS